MRCFFPIAQTFTNPGRNKLLIATTMYLHTVPENTELSHRFFFFISIPLAALVNSPRCTASPHSLHNPMCRTLLMVMRQARLTISHCTDTHAPVWTIPATRLVVCGEGRCNRLLIPTQNSAQRLNTSASRLPYHFSQSYLLFFPPLHGNSWFTLHLKPVVGLTMVRIGWELGSRFCAVADAAAQR